jgi:ATP-dependent exoDNAse (exonuclease V) alpha subunit
VAFSVGDRVQLIAPSSNLTVANRELGTVKGIGQDGRMSLMMDGGREVEIDSAKHLHLDHGYAVTIHSSQGQTADWVLIHVDTELGAKDLLNNRMPTLPSRPAHTTRKSLPTTARSWEPRWSMMYRTAAPMRRR